MDILVLVSGGAHAVTAQQMKAGCYLLWRFPLDTDSKLRNISEWWRIGKSL